MQIGPERRGQQEREDGAGREGRDDVIERAALQVDDLVSMREAVEGEGGG